MEKTPPFFPARRALYLLSLVGMWPRALLLIFIVLQAADGLLTYAAVERFGTSVEGNPLLVTWIMLTGLEPALIGAKTMACLCGGRSEEHTSELQSQSNLVCRLLLEKNNR